jgi:DNA-binding NarL/FixJ family response regulator
MEVPSAIKLVVVEDHGVLLEGLEVLLSIEGFDVVGSTADPNDALIMVEEAEPDVALVDIFLGKGNGIDLARKMLRTRPDLAVLFYTGYEDIDLALESLGSGARGYALKDRPPAELMEAIRTVASGQTYIDPRLQSSLLASGASDVERLALDLLSPVSVIQGFAELLERDVDAMADEQLEQVRRIALAAGELQSKLQRVLRPTEPRGELGSEQTPATSSRQER